MTIENGTRIDIEKLHERLPHSEMRTVMNTGLKLNLDVKGKTGSCEPCAKAKAK